MQTVALSWQHSFEVDAVVGGTGVVLAVPDNKHVRTIGAFLREAAVIGVLYGLWRLAGEVSQRGREHAFGRAEWIESFEGHVGFPPEHDVQHLILGMPWVVQVANLYYATMHFSMMFVFLIWLFLRHRDAYKPVRQVMAWTTLACLAVQTVLPTAPPRMLPGIVDTAQVYDQSVYTNGFQFDQLSAMPSVHVAWCVLVGWYAWRFGGSRWRFLGVAHAALTIFIVVATGNHWWLDGVVAVLLLAAAAWGVYGARRGITAALDAVRPKDREPQPA